MCDMPFFKFPSTPHLLFSSENISRTDKLLPIEEKELLFSNPITIEEKIDGANLGISFTGNGDLFLQNRGQYLYQPYLGQWEKLSSWLAHYQDMLFDVLENNLILFGEWCYAKHSILYSGLPNWFIAFDIYDISAQQFYSVSRRNDIITKIGIPIVPQIAYGKFSISDIPSLLRQSSYGDSPCEGLYFRLDQDDWLKVRAKYVRRSFAQSIEQHWTNSPLQKNQVIY